MKLFFKIFFLITVFITGLHAQEYKSFNVYRGDKKTLTFKYKADVTADELLFVVKQTNSQSSPRLVQKKNAVAGGDSSQVYAVYSSPYTTIQVTLDPGDMMDLTAPVSYYYDISATDASDTTDVTTLFYGNVYLDPDVGTPVDGATLPADGTRITTTALDNGSAQSDVIIWDTTGTKYNPVSVDSLKKLLDAADSSAVAESLATHLAKLDSLFTYKADSSNTVFINKWQNITAQKNFLGGLKAGVDSTLRIDVDTSKIVFSDSNQAFIQVTNNLGFGDYWFWAKNFYVNSDTSRPDHVLRITKNLTPGGTLINPAYAGLFFSMEDFYNGNGFPASEIHLGFTGTDGVERRLLTSDYNQSTNDMSLGFMFDLFKARTHHNNIFFQISDSVHWYYYYNTTNYFAKNNYSFIQQRNAADNNYIEYPYYDNQNRLYFPTNTLHALSDIVKLDSMDLQIINNYSLKFLNTSGTSFNAFRMKVDNNLYINNPYGSIVVEDLGSGSVFQINNSSSSRMFIIQEATGEVGIGNISDPLAKLDVEGNIFPHTDDSYYLGKNDDDSPHAWKGIILKDQVTGTYYRIEILNGVITATDLTD